MTSQDYRKLSVLLTQIKGGARNAFSSVYKMYEKKVYFLFCKLLGNKAEAADMTAELFAHIYLQIANFPDVMEFEKWLYTTLFARARRHNLEKNPELLGEYTDTDSPDGDEVDELLSQDSDEMMSYPEGIDISVDMMKTVDTVLTDLPVKLRTAVLGYYLCGFDMTELAAIEQISVAAVKNRLLKARINMKTQEHKYTELGYDCAGLVVFLPDILATMSQTIVIPSGIATAVSSRTGINCESSGKETVTSVSTASPVKSSNYAPTEYAVQPQPKKIPGEDISPAVRVLMAIVALLIIIGATVAVVLAVQNSKKPQEEGTVGHMENEAVQTTIEFTLKETTTVPETTTEEITTQEETTTQEFTTAEETTTATEEATTEETTTVAENEPAGGEEPEDNYAVG